MGRVIILLLILPNISGCGLLVLHSALERNADNKETHESHRHQERMRELDIQERQLQRVQPLQDAGIVRDNPF